MVADDMPFVVEALHQIRIVPDEASGAEEAGLDIVLFQDVKNRRRKSILIPLIEGEIHILFRGRHHGIGVVAPEEALVLIIPGRLIVCQEEGSPLGLRRPRRNGSIDLLKLLCGLPVFLLFGLRAALALGTALRARSTALLVCLACRSRARALVLQFRRRSCQRRNRRTHREKTRQKNCKFSVFHKMPPFYVNFSLPLL